MSFSALISELFQATSEVAEPTIQTVQQLEGELNALKSALSIGIVLFAIAAFIIIFLVSVKLYKRKLRKRITNY